MMTANKLKPTVLGITAIHRLSKLTKRRTIKSKFQNLVQKAVAAAQNGAKPKSKPKSNKFKAVVGSFVAITRMSKLVTKRALRTKFRTVVKSLMASGGRQRQMVSAH